MKFFTFIFLCAGVTYGADQQHVDFSSEVDTRHEDCSAAAGGGASAQVMIIPNDRDICEDTGNPLCKKAVGNFYKFIYRYCESTAFEMGDGIYSVLQCFTFPFLEVNLPQEVKMQGKMQNVVLQLLPGMFGSAYKHLFKLAPKRRNSSLGTTVELCTRIDFLDYIRGYAGIFQTYRLMYERYLEYSASTHKDRILSTSFGAEPFYTLGWLRPEGESLIPFSIHHDEHAPDRYSLIFLPFFKSNLQLGVPLSSGRIVESPGFFIHYRGDASEILSFRSCDGAPDFTCSPHTINGSKRNELFESIDTYLSDFADLSSGIYVKIPRTAIEMDEFLAVMMEDLLSEAERAENKSLLLLLQGLAEEVLPEETDPIQVIDALYNRIFEQEWEERRLRVMDGTVGDLVPAASAQAAGGGARSSRCAQKQTRKKASCMKQPPVKHFAELDEIKEQGRVKFRHMARIVKLVLRDALKHNPELVMRQINDGSHFNFHLDNTSAKGFTLVRRHGRQDNTYAVSEVRSILGKLLTVTQEHMEILSRTRVVSEVM